MSIHHTLRFFLLFATLCTLRTFAETYSPSCSYYSVPKGSSQEVVTTWQSAITSACEAGGVISDYVSYPSPLCRSSIGPFLTTIVNFSHYPPCRRRMSSCRRLRMAFMTIAVVSVSKMPLVLFAPTLQLNSTLTCLYFPDSFTYFVR